MDFVRRGKKIIAIGENYLDHIKELNSVIPTEVMFFLKPTTSYLKSPATILIPPKNNIHHEVELGVVIGKTGFQIKAENALDHVSGYALALDLTARDIQFEARKKGYPWSLCKGYDHFTPIGKFIPKESIPNPDNVRIWVEVSKKIRQNENTGLMVFKVPEIIEYVSNVMTLEEGDLIITGTPKGVGQIVEGDSVVAGIEYEGKELDRIDFQVKNRT
ncbi:Acylpyruvase FAHD1, mitochondrial [Smittium culicis]|uniref:Acylpyruvase FAHD1, mitochondrial n=1 Tax=Smittium culicis TaxID=133412 RepID=A0A1R1XR52_9FUNG|nr:Acylpyruvase FAHD1, mitochondrial [Smittium culicis]OMJ25497.1 Acylpyruvase FAHD1, mitochondrial [Smittium culicis]